MFQKAQIIFLQIISIFLVSIQSKEEFNKNKFLSKPQIKNSKSNPDLVSFEEDHKVINIKCLFSENYNFYSLQALQDKKKRLRI